MSKKNYPPEFLELLKSVKGKRPRTVIEHILENGQVTTEELKDIYGYNHPPRAIRDVREQGIPIETFRVTGSDGRRIGAYKFGNPSDVRATQLSGRTAFSSAMKTKLIEKHGTRCNIYLESFPERDLQIDHRIPFEIAGDNVDMSEDADAYMLICPSANRAKSWSCENCENWTLKEVSNCQSCYWAFPESYSHVAMREIRRLDVLWAGEEVTEYDQLKETAGKVGEETTTYVKSVLRNHLESEGD